MNSYAVLLESYIYKEDGTSIRVDSFLEKVFPNEEQLDEAIGFATRRFEFQYRERECEDENEILAKNYFKPYKYDKDGSKVWNIKYKNISTGKILEQAIVLMAVGNMIDELD